MKVRVFGVYRSFDYRQIGGTDSYFRRLGRELAKRGYSVEFILYNCPKTGSEIPEKHFSISFFASFDEALKHLADEQGPVLVNAVSGRDRLRFIRFRYRTRLYIQWIMIYSLMSELWWPRFKYFIEARLYSYNGGSLCMSERLSHYASSFITGSRYLVPPVDRLFFVRPEEKISDKRFRVTYIGRLEEGKGADEAVGIFEGLSGDERFELTVLAYAFDGDPDADSYDRRFRALPDLEYSRREHSGWKPETDEVLARQLAKTDILLLPYRRVSSSIDTPLLLLEGMASLCCCICPPLGDLPRVIGPSPFLVGAERFVTDVLSLLRELNRDDIEREQQRLFKHCQDLVFDTPSVVDRLLVMLGEEKMDGPN